MSQAGPQMRHAVRRALISGDPQRMKLVGKVVVGELLRRGDLVRVAIESQEAIGGPFCLLKGSTQLVDLGPLDGATYDLDAPLWRPAVDSAPETPVSAPPAGPGDFQDFTGVLGVMEQAQDLDLGAPQAGEAGSILAGILRLLSRFTPQFRLFAILDGDDPIPEQQQLVFNASSPEVLTRWQGARTPGHAVFIPSVAELPGCILCQDGLPSGAANVEGAFKFQMAVAVPIWSHGPGEVGDPLEAGLLYLVADQSWPREQILKLGRRLSKFVTRRWRHQHGVIQAINTDALTGLYNRAFFDNQFTIELERARRTNHPLTLVIADLDHFKTVNDELGHHAGDLALQMVARRLQEELRRIDLICRIGGEEFALVLPDTSLEAGKEVMTRLLNAPFRTEFLHEEERLDLKVTFSFGAVTFPEAGTDAFELYRKADAMLYLSKDLGRNQCHFWSSEGDHQQLLPGS